MTTLKLAIRMPEELVREVEEARKEESMSRSSYITRLVRQEVRRERQAGLKANYDRIFADPEIAEEQLNITRAFDWAGNDQGQD